MQKILLLLILIACLASCEKAEKLDGDDYFIFGIYNGYCIDNCTSLFKIEDGSLYADDSETFYPSQELKFEEAPLSQSKFDLAEDVFEKLPSKLINSSESSFGCPGCVDQDIILLIYYDGVEEKLWQVDTDLDMIPEYLVQYAEEVIELVNQLVE